MPAAIATDTFFVPVIDPPAKLPDGVRLPLPHEKYLRDGGSAWFREVRIPLWANHDFKGIWKTHKLAFLKRGYSIKQVDGAWVLQQWLSGERGQHYLTNIGAEKLRNAISPPDALPLEATPVLELELPPLPHGLESFLYEYQRQPARQLYRAVMNGKAEWGYPGAWDCSDLGCHAKGEMILMADGEAREVETIRVGDEVAGWQGPQTVTALKRGTDQMARIIPVKGMPFEVNMGHILTLQYSPTAQVNGPKKGNGLTRFSGKIIDVSVRDFLALPANHRAQLKLFRAGVAWWQPKELPLDPYFMGVILGDGSTRTHAVSVTTMDQEIVDFLAIHAAGMCARLVKVESKNRCPQYFFRQAAALNAVLRELKLWHITSKYKFIPHGFKTGSVEQRREILAGLIDTDGCVSCGGFDFVSKSSRLANDTAFVARSLGLAAYVKACVKTCGQNKKRGLYWRVSISGDCSVIPCRIARKRAALRTQKKSVLRTSFKVQIIPNAEFYGFSLSGDGRFLLGDFTVTHNTGKTFQALAAAVATGLEVGVICPKSVIGTFPKYGGKGSGWLGAFAHFKQVPAFVLNYESLRTGNREHVKKTGNPGRPFEWTADPEHTILIWDEAHNVKGKTKNRSMAFAAQRQGFPCLFVSGTMAQSPMNLAASGIAVGLHGGDKKSYEQFLAQHGCQNYGGSWDFPKGRAGAVHLAKIHRTVFPKRGARVKIADLGDRFPETQILCESVETEDTAAINEAWDKAKEIISELERDGANEGRVKMMSAVAYMEAWHASERVKVATICDMVRREIEEGRSVAVFVNFTDVRETLSRELKTQCMIFGGQAQHHRDACIADFQSGKARVILANIKAGGVGISLHDTDGEYPRTAIILPTNNAVEMGQALGRVHRAGGKSRSRQLVLFAAGSIEEQICESTRRKLSAIATLNDGDLQPTDKF